MTNINSSSILLLKATVDNKYTFESKRTKKSYIACYTFFMFFLSTPMGVDYVVIGFDIHNALSA